MFKIKDVILETESIGLAEKFTTISKELFVLVETNDELELGKSYYFGIEIQTGDICEVKGIVIEPFNGENKSYKLRLVECDENYLNLLINTIETSSNKTKSDQQNEPMWGIGLKQTNSSYAIIVNSPAGVYTDKQLEVITNIARNGYGIVKLTHAQRFVILVKAEQLLTVENELNSCGLRKGVLHHGMRNIRACTGSLCKWSKNNDAISLAIELDKKFYGFPAKFDVKIAISDCLRNCSESYCADIGYIGLDGCYRLVIGGRGSQVPFRAIELLPNVPKNKVIDVTEKLVNWYVTTANEKERLCKTLQRIGNEIFEAKSSSEKTNIKSQFEKIDSILNPIGDGISESQRLFEQYLRTLAVNKLKEVVKEVL